MKTPAERRKNEVLQRARAAAYQPRTPQQLEAARYKRFEDMLPTNVRNILARHNIIEPWNMSLKELLRIPGIGPQMIQLIAHAVEKTCV